MFLGMSENAVDEKGRLTIPARFRPLLEQGAYVTQGFDQNLMIMLSADFEAIYDRINQMSITDPSIRQLRRFLFGRAEKLEIDRVGRILLPQALRNYAQLAQTAMVVGVGEHIEIWSLENWQRQDEALMDAEANAERFASLNLSGN